MIAGVTTLLNESIIIESTLTNLFSQGVDRIYADIGPCTDNTRDIVATFPEVVIHDDISPIHHQPALIDMLAHQAGADGATWIIPFDADEYWHGESAPTIAEALTAVDPSVGIIWVGQYHYHTREYRWPAINGLNKVAYRYHPTAAIANGNHFVTGVLGEPAHGILLIRELQFSSYDHFKAKVADRCRTLDPAAESRGDGGHMTWLRDADEATLYSAWAELAGQATVYDPIP